MHTIRVRLGIALAVGVAVGLLVPLGPAQGRLPHVLVGFVAGGLTFAVWTLGQAMRFDAAQTAEHVAGDDPGARTSDVLVIVVGLIGLGGVAVLLGGSSGGRSAQAVDAVIGIAAVAVGWLCVHTVYLLRYARIYYSDPTPCIDFNQSEPPRYSDFAYFSFNLGMTYQVSDTGLRGSGIRRVVLGHCLLAYVFGTVVIASTINLVIGLGAGLGSAG